MHLTYSSPLPWILKPPRILHLSHCRTSFEIVRIGLHCLPFLLLPLGLIFLLKHSHPFSCWHFMIFAGLWSIHEPAPHQHIHACGRAGDRYNTLRYCSA